MDVPGLWTWTRTRFGRAASVRPAPANYPATPVLISSADRPDEAVSPCTVPLKVSGRHRLPSLPSRPARPQPHRNPQPTHTTCARLILTPRTPVNLSRGTEHMPCLPPRANNHHSRNISPLSSAAHVRPAGESPSQMDRSVRRRGGALRCGKRRCRSRLSPSRCPPRAAVAVVVVGWLCFSWSAVIRTSITNLP